MILYYEQNFNRISHKISHKTDIQWNGISGEWWFTKWVWDHPGTAGAGIKGIEKGVGIEK